MKRVIGSVIGWCLVAVLFGACANTSTKKTVESATKRAVPTETLSELSYQQPVLGKSISLDFDDDTTLYRDGGSDRPVHGIRLPDAKGELVLKIVTYRQGTVEEPAIFYPEVRVLDATFQMTKVLPYNSYVFRAGSKSFLEGTFFLKGPSANEHYLVITNREIADSDLKVTQTNVTESHLIAPGFALWTVHTGTSTAPTKMIAHTEGEVTVTISEYVLKSIDQKN
jgi:Maltose operon periplasmic protein precursor (MalM)